MAARIKELEAAIDVLRQAVLEVRHAQNSGPNWYTKGSKGLYMQVSMWLNKADEALKSIDSTNNQQDSQ